MKYLVLLILFISCGTYKYPQKRNIETEISVFLFDKKQITQEQKNKIKNNFNGYITIVSLQQKKFDKDNGVYIFSLNSSHNYKYFLLFKSMDFKIINTNDNLEAIKKEIFDFGFTLTNLEEDAIRDIVIYNQTIKKRFYIKKLD